MIRKPVDRALVRAVGDRRRERRRAVAQSLASEFTASERDFEAMFAAAEEPGLFERAITWLQNLELPVLLVVAPNAVRGDGVVRREADDAPDAASLSVDGKVRVQIAFENHHAEPVWVVACEQEPDGTVSFVPAQDLAQAPRVDPGDALAFDFTPLAETTVRVVAIALATPPHGDPAEVLAEPARLQEFGVVATARFVLKVGPAAKHRDNT